MPITQTEIDDTKELFSALAPIRTRKMMGGLAIYAHDVTFAMYDPNQGYFLKSDDQTHQLFEDEGCEKFTFEMKDKIATMNYYSMPESAMDDPDECEHWARISLDVALRVKAKKSSKRKTTP